MSDHDRLTQLRVLMERLERMPASPDRDWMLAEVRSRAVDIDTGIAPRPMRPLESGTSLEPEHIVAKRLTKVTPTVAPKPAPRAVQPPPPARPAPRRVAPRAAAPATKPKPHSTPAAEAPFWEATFPKPSVDDDRVDLLAFDGLLNLGDDTPATEPAEGEGPTSRPWAGGLRG